MTAIALIWMVAIIPLSFFPSAILGDDECGSLWTNSFIDETGKVGDLFLKTNTSAVASLEWRTANPTAAKYVKLISEADFIAVEIIEELSDSADCLVDVESSGIDLYLPGEFLISCTDGTTETGKIFIKVENNRPPQFDKPEYKLVNVSRRLPSGVNLLNVYPNQLGSILVQDIDRESNGEQMGNIIGEISDSENLFAAPMLSEKVEKPSEFCSSLGNSGNLDAYKFELVLNTDIPQGVISPYTVTLVAKDQDGNAEEAKLIIEFLKEDLLPPNFESDFYYSFLQSPEFSGEKVLAISPTSISALDPDGDSVVFSLEFPNNSCKKSFEIDPYSGEVKWKAAIEKDCQESDIIIAQLKACQENGPSQCSATTLTIAILGNEYKPKFSNSIYEAEQIKITATPGEKVIVINGPIEATVSNLFESIPVVYEIDSEIFELADENVCEITVKNSTLGEESLVVLTIKATADYNNKSEATFTSLKIPIQVDNLGPVFENSSYTFHIEDPKFQSPQSLFTILALDGDSDINAEIGYEIPLEPSNCQGCFSIGPTDGILQWIGEIPKESIRAKSVLFDVEAYQREKPEMKATVQVSITFPGDELGPKFTKEKYAGTLTWDGNVTLTDKIEAKDQDGYLDDPVDIEILESKIFQLDQSSGEISANQNFNPDILAPEGIILILKANQLNNPDRFGNAIVELTYDFNAYPPDFNVKSENLGPFDEIGVITQEGQIIATDTDNLAVIAYELSENVEARYKLDTFPDNSVKLSLITMPTEDTVDILIIEAYEKNAIPERKSSIPVLVKITAEHSNDTTTTEDPITTTSISTISTSSSSPIDCTSEFDQLIYDGFEINEGGEGDTTTIPCGQVNSSQSGSECNSGPSYSITGIFPDIFQPFIALNEITGEFRCRSIWTETEDNYPAKIAVEIRDNFDAEAVALFALIPASNHAPQILDKSLVFGYPSFVFLQYPIQFSLGKIQASDADMEDAQLKFELMEENEYFHIDAFLGSIHCRNLEYLREIEETTLNASVSDGKNTVKFTFKITPIEEENIIAVKASKEESDDDIVAKLDSKFAELSFRVLKSESTKETGDEKLLFLTVYQMGDNKLDIDGGHFLSREEANLIIGGSDVGVEVTDDFSISNPILSQEREENSALLPLLIVFAVLFGILAIANGAYFWYHKKSQSSKLSQSSVQDLLNEENQDRFTGTMARKNYIFNQMEAEQGKKRVAPAPPPLEAPAPENLEAPEKSGKLADKTIKFNENAEVIAKTDDDSSSEDSDDDVTQM